MKILFSLLLAAFAGIAQGQYYYQDIIGTKNICRQMANYTAQKVASVTATGFDAMGKKSADFNEWQEIDKAKNTWKVTTRNNTTVTRQYYQFDNKNTLLKIIDSSAAIRSEAIYTYANEKLSKITIQLIDAGNDFNQTEERSWFYNSSGHPEKMLRIINQKDSFSYNFILDDHGLVTAEAPAIKRIGTDTIYYYYNEDGWLTDIVRYNKKLNQLLPDVMFEYDDNGIAIQKTTIVSVSTRDYLIWRYAFNQQGLKTKEALFNKQRELTGRIDYQYTFTP